MHRYQAVSYTHLDVYKRQALHYANMLHVKANCVSTLPELDYMKAPWERILAGAAALNLSLIHISRMNDVTTLREEMEQIRNYVQVLKIRFQDRFEVYYDYDEECLDCIIVKFMLQPLVENSLTHGLSET